MAFLTFRQSDQSVTDAQTQKHHVILGVPLTMYHVDANFKAINDQLVDYSQKYGLGVSRGDTQLTIAQIFGSNDINAVGSSGFYRLSTSANSPAGVGNGVLIHAQNAEGGIDDVTAIQLTAGVNSDGGQVLYYRTKQGANTWNSWQHFASTSDVDITVDALRESIDECVKKAGDTMTGQLTLTNKFRLTGNNEMISISARKGTTPSTTTLDGFTVYDSSGVVNESTKLGFFGLKQTYDGFSGFSFTVTNPASSGSSQSTEVMIGWKQDDNGNYVPYTQIPTPSGTNTNQMATTGWVQNEIQQIIVDNNTFSTDGGIINGEVIIENNLSITGQTEANDVHISGTLSIDNPLYASLSLEKGQLPSAAINSVGNGYLIVDSAADDSDRDPELHTGGRVWGQVDYLGNFTTELASYNWNTTDDIDQVKKASISVTISKDGNTITTSAPTPPTDDRSQQIATTEWVQQTAQTLINQSLVIYEDDHPWDMGVL